MVKQSSWVKHLKIMDFTLNGIKMIGNVFLSTVSRVTQFMATLTLIQIQLDSIQFQIVRALPTSYQDLKHWSGRRVLLYLKAKIIHLLSLIMVIL